MFQTSVGVAIDSDRVSVVCLKKGMKGIRISAHSIFYLNKEKPLHEWLDGFGEWLEAFLKENRADGRGGFDIFLGIPREMAVIKEIQLPRAVKENLRSAVRFELEKHVPLPEDDVCFDCHILSEDKADNQLHILLVIAKRSDIVRYLGSMESHGRIAGIDLSSAGTVNFLSYLPDHGISENDISEIIRNPHRGERLRETSGAGIPSPEFAPAFGLALKGLIPVRVDINLIPPAMRKKPSRLGFYTMIGLISLVLLSLLVLGGSHLIRQNLTLNRLDVQLTRFTTEISNLDRIRQKTHNLETRLSYLNSFQGGDFSIIDVLRELTQVIPETAWIQELSYSEKGLQLDGYAETATNLVPLLEASPLFRNVVFLSSITKDRNGKDRFRLGLEINF